MKKYIILKLLILIGELSLNAQLINPFPLGTSCANAIVVCPLDGYSSINRWGANSIDMPITFCGSIQNNQWIGFIAGSEELTCDVIVGSCYSSDGLALQVQAYAICGNPWTAVSNCLYEVYANSTETLQLSNLIIGDKYYLMIDGQGGAVCEYSIDITEGFTLSSNTSNVADAGVDVIINCLGEEVILDGSNSIYELTDSIYWVDKNDVLLSNDITLTVSEPGKYYLIVENGEGCMLVDEVEVIEEVLPNPFLFTWVDIILDSSGQSLFLEAIDTSLVNSNYIYSWTTTNGEIVAHADSIFPLISEVGHYHLEIVDPVSECIFTGFVYVNSFCPVSIFSPTKNTLDVEITPTITNDEIRVHYVIENVNSVSIQIYNIGGVLLQDIDFGKKGTGEHLEDLSLKDFSAGVYFVFVKTEEGSAVRKVVKF